MQHWGYSVQIHNAHLGIARTEHFARLTLIMGVFHTEGKLSVALELKKLGLGETGASNRGAIRDAWDSIIGLTLASA